MFASMQERALIELLSLRGQLRARFVNFDPRPALAEMGEKERGEKRIALSRETSDFHRAS